MMCNLSLIISLALSLSHLFKNPVSSLFRQTAERVSSLVQRAENFALQWFGE